MKNKSEIVLDAARKLYAERPEWIVFYREIFGVVGLVKTYFLDARQLSEFQASDSYRELMDMLNSLRDVQREPEREPTRVITVRLPRSLHDSLLAEAHDHKTSMNQLCISKLLAPLQESAAT